MKNLYDSLNNAKTDLSIYEEETITREDAKLMKNKVLNSAPKHKKPKYVFAVCAAVIAVTCTAFAGEAYKIISTGYNSFYQYNNSYTLQLPKELQNKFYKENGEPYTTVTKDDFKNMYDEKGNKLTEKQIQEIYKTALGDVLDDYDPEENIKTYSTIDDMEQNLNFDLKVPQYLPEGFTLSKAWNYTENDGTISGLYGNLEYTNDAGDKITVFERLLNEDTAFSSVTDGEIEETKINGNTAVISDNSSIDWETADNVSVGIHTHGCVSKEEMIKIAENTQ